MRKTLIIISREYLSRVRTKAFLLLTLIAPVAYLLLFSLPVVFASYGKAEREVKVYDASGQLRDRVESDETYNFSYLEPGAQTLQDAIADLDDKTLVLYFKPDFDIFRPYNIDLYSSKSVSIKVKEGIERRVEDAVRQLKIEILDLKPSLVDSLKTNVSITTKIMGEGGIQESSSGAASAAAFGSALMIYLFIFLYGGLVFRAVHEEKQNRIVEVLISSIKPFQLMMGKIVALALVGLTQLLIWAVVIVAISLAAGPFLAPDPALVADAPTNADAFRIVEAIQSLPLFTMLLAFVFYFISGYLFYSSLFAAAAAAADNQSDAQQFMFPISLPIIVSLTMLGSVIDNPDSTVAVVFSMLPFTSPVIMMARIPFGVSAVEILLSMLLMIAGFVFTVWLAGKIYRVGILMYGKKASLKEVARWLRYRN